VTTTLGTEAPVIRTVELAWTDGQVTSAGDGDFTVRVRVAPPSPTARRQIDVDVRYDGAEPVAASVRFRAELAAPQAPWWLIPGVFYGENRPADSRRIFPRFVAGGGDPDAMESDRWEFRADRSATPAVFAWTGDAGIAVVATESTALGLTGLGLAYDAATGRAGVHVRFPYQEAPITYYGSAEPRPALAEEHVWQPGERVRLTLALYELPADRHSYAPVLREEYERARATAPLNPWVDVPTAADLAAEGLHRWHYAQPGVLLETVGFDREVTGQDGRPVDRQAMHVGWVSGTPWAYSLLAHGRRTGSADEVEAAENVLDFICSELSPSGTFWATWYRTRGWYHSWSPVVHSLHSRTLGEATLFVIRALELAAGVRSAHPVWTAAVRSNLDSVVARQRADGNLGAAHHAITGEVLSWDGCAGLAWVNALAEAQRWDDDGHYLAAAVRAGEYYADFVTAEYLNGAPEDVDLAPTSEDGYVAVMAYMSLFRRTGEARWLDLARRAADWMLTFRYSYNVAFPAGTLLDVYRFASRGADTASPSNQHLHAYGLVCTAELAELSAALGDPYYVERARESLACFRQFIARFDGDFNAYRGMASERYYQTACFQPKGMLLTLSHAWSVGVLLLACEQALAEPQLLAEPR
jgi:hypothetical protein